MSYVTVDVGGTPVQMSVSVYKKYVVAKREEEFKNKWDTIKEEAGIVPLDIPETRTTRRGRRTIEQEKAYSEETESSMVKAQAERVTSGRDVELYKKAREEGYWGTFNQYLQEKGQSPLGKSLSDYEKPEPSYYYNVPVLSSTGKGATLGMSPAFLEKYQEARSNVPMIPEQMPSPLANLFYTDQGTAQIGSPFKTAPPEPKYDIMTEQREVKEDRGGLFGYELGGYGTFAKATTKTVEDPFSAIGEWSNVFDPTKWETSMGELSKRDPYVVAGEWGGLGLIGATLWDIPQTVKTSVAVGRGIGTRLGITKAKPIVSLQKGEIASFSYDFDDFTFGLGKGTTQAKTGEKIADFSTRQMFSITPGKIGKKVTLFGEIAGKDKIVYATTTADIVKTGSKTELRNIMTGLYSKGDRKFLEVAKWGTPRQKDIISLKGFELGKGLTTDRAGMKLTADILKKESAIAREFKVAEYTARRGRAEKMFTSFVREEQRMKWPKDIMVIGKEAPKPPRIYGPMKPYGVPKGFNDPLKALLKEQTRAGVTSISKSTMPRMRIESMARPVPVYDAKSYIRSGPMDFDFTPPKAKTDLAKGMFGEPPTKDLRTGLDPFTSTREDTKHLNALLGGYKTKKKARGRDRGMFDASLTVPVMKDKQLIGISSLMKQAQPQKERQRQRTTTALTSLFEKSFTSGRGGRRPIRGFGFPPMPPPPPDPFATRKRKKRGKKPKKVYRKTRYTPSLMGALNLIDPIKTAPKGMLTGLRVRPKVKKKKGGE